MMCDFVDAEIDDECCGFLYHHDHKRSWMNAVESLVLSVEQYKMLWDGGNALTKMEFNIDGLFTKLFRVCSKRIYAEMNV